MGIDITPDNHSRVAESRPGGTPEGGKDGKFRERPKVKSDTQNSRAMQSNNRRDRN